MYPLHEIMKYIYINMGVMSMIRHWLYMDKMHQKERKKCVCCCVAEGPPTIFDQALTMGKSCYLLAVYYGDVSPKKFLSV